MTVVHRVLVETIHLAGRQLNNRALGGTQTTTSADPTQVAATTAATPTQTMANGNGGTSSPLLFFVALGFGVVFTNLWIIVGVKYCFRYNARNRALRNGEDVDPITLDAMPARPHRRRREKKLMTMEEVNERFPLTKYKAWVASRASEGLPTTGGVTVSTSRAVSLKGADGVLPSTPGDSKHTATVTVATGQTPSGSNVVSGEEKHADTTTVAEASDEHNPLKQVQTTASTLHKDPKDAAAGSDDEDEDDDHIHTAVPPELLANPGDSCAICIDTLEEDDDIRGLTCGHAFHASCLDPWLTSRRACCPLCKADYFTPKPRPENPEAAQRTRLPQPPASAWGIRGNTRLMLPGRFLSSVPADGTDAGAAQRQSRRSRSAPVPGAAPGRTWLPRNPFRNVHIPGRSTPTATPAVGAEPSPSQLEAGTAR